MTPEEKVQARIDCAEKSDWANTLFDFAYWIVVTLALFGALYGLVRFVKWAWMN